MLRRAVTVAAGSRRHAASGEGGWLLPAPPMRLATRLLLMLLTCAAILWLGMLDRQPRASSSNPVPVRLASALKPLRTHVHSPHVRNQGPGAEAGWAATVDAEEKIIYCEQCGRVLAAAV